MTWLNDFLGQSDNPITAATAAANGQQSLDPQTQQGILAQAQTQGALAGQQPQFDWGGALSSIGRGFAIAGSPNPSQTYMEFAKADKEARDANKPKVTPLADGAFSLVTYPDGSTKVMKNEDVAQFLREQETNKMANALVKIGYQGQVTQANQAANLDNKTASEQRPVLNNLNSTIDLLKQGLETVQGQGRAAQAVAIPGIRGIAEFFGNKDAAGNMLLSQIKVDKALQETARTKGAISDNEMKLFLSPTPNETADRETVWKPWLENQINVLTKLKPLIEAEVARGEKGPGANIPAPGGKGAPAAAPQVMSEAQVKSAGIAYDPGYEYAMVNGQLMKRKKGN